MTQTAWVQFRIGIGPDDPYATYDENKAFLAKDSILDKVKDEMEKGTDGCFKVKNITAELIGNVPDEENNDFSYILLSFDFTYVQYDEDDKYDLQDMTDNIEHVVKMLGGYSGYRYVNAELNDSKDFTLT